MHLAMSGVCIAEWVWVFVTVQEYSNHMDHGYILFYEKVTA